MFDRIILLYAPVETSRYNGAVLVEHGSADCEEDEINFSRHGLGGVLLGIPPCV